MSDLIAIYNRYADDLDEKFDDCLVIEYQRWDPNKPPTFKILYDPSVSVKKLKRSLPKKWVSLEKKGQIILDIRKYTTDCPEHKKAEDALNIMKHLGHYDRLMDNLSQI